MSICSICNKIYCENFNDCYICQTCGETFCSQECYLKVCQPCIKCRKLIHTKDFVNIQDLPLINWCKHLNENYGTCFNCIENDKYYYYENNKELILYCTQECCVKENNLNSNNEISLWNNFNEENSELDFDEDSNEDSNENQNESFDENSELDSDEDSEEN